MKKDENEEIKKDGHDTVKEPTLADGVPVPVKLTKKQKFLNLFKQTDVSLNQLKRLLIYVAIVAFLESVMVIKFKPINFALAIVMLGNIIPFKSENIKTSTWKMLYVTIPVTIGGLVLNHFVFGIESLMISTLILSAMTLLTAIVQLLSLIITRKFKAHIFNFVLYGLTAVLQIVFYAALWNTQQ